MKANLKSLLDVLGRPDSRYVVPVFQRVYSWTRQQCEQLWEDIFNANKGKSMCFMGALILMPDGRVKDVDCFSIIDGQQRLATLTLMLIALRDALSEQQLEQSICKADEIDKTYLKASGHGCKLQLSEQDVPTLEHLIMDAGSSEDADISSFLLDNLDFFREKIKSDEPHLLEMLPALETLTIIAVELESEDAPQQVFESLNSKGKPLTTTDLIRNMLLDKFGYGGQERLLETYWTPLDEAFSRFGCERDIYLDAALHQWITTHGGLLQVPKRTDLYQAFKRYVEAKTSPDLEGILESISSSCLEFACNPCSSEARRHLDWAIDKPTGSISARKVFGD